MHIGNKAPVFTATAVCNDGVRYMHSAELKGAWSIVTFLPQDEWLQEQCSRACSNSLTENDLWVLFVRSDASPRTVRSVTGTLLPHSMTLIDPLGWLHRRFGVRRTSSPKCRSFLIDPNEIVRFQLVHDLSRYGMSLLEELVFAAQLQDTTACVSRRAADRCEPPLSACASRRA